MSIIDTSIIFLYLIGMVLVGFYFHKKASSGIDSYFLGNKKIPWWALGSSGMASNFDVSGTMINVALIYSFGAAGFFIEMRGGLVLILAFLMIFMGKWNRRANVMTLAEWMIFRFGNGRQGKIARIISALAIIITTVSIVSYFSLGAGKFFGDILKIPEVFGLSTDFLAASVIILIATFYTVASGLYGVIWTDVFQGILILLIIISVAFISFTSATIPDLFSVSVPLTDGGFMPVQVTREQWTNLIPSWTLDFPPSTAYAAYNLFGISLLFYLIKVIIEGSAGTGGYMIQRFYASRSDRDAGLLSVLWIFLLAFRWPFIAAIAILGISYSQSNHLVITDPEKVLPAVIFNVMPVGLKGFFIASLLAAAMSTFDSLINSGASYWVRDIYQGYINPSASQSKLIKHSRWSSVIIVLAGLFLSLNLQSINNIWGWLTMGIGAGLLIPLLIRWYWWRLNGYGFAAGVASGMVAAILQRWLLPSVPEYISFSIIVSASFIFTIVVTLITPPTDRDTLLKFYSKTRPFGFWGTIKKQLPENELYSIDQENKRDIIAICFALPWQITLFLIGMAFVMKIWNSLFILLLFFAILSAGLYYFWYRHLSQEVNS